MTVKTVSFSSQQRTVAHLARLFIISHNKTRKQGYLRHIWYRKGAVTPGNFSCNFPRNFVATQVERIVAQYNMP